MQKMKYTLSVTVLALLMLSSCVSQKKYKKQLALYDTLKQNYDHVEFELKACLSEKDKNATRVKTLEEELAYTKSISNSLIKQLSDLSVISTAQSESIKKSMDNINAKDKYIKGLQSEMSRKDSLNMALVMNLKGALKDVNDEDVQIKVEGSAVMISISDKMLFKSGSYEISPEAKSVLAKVAAVIQSKPDIQFMVEGHTDNNPIKSRFITDNWDLSVMRSTAVVRILQNDFKVDPKRMIAAGRAEYLPLVANDTDEGKARNRRTRIIILPQLDQFFKLLETQE